MEETTKAQTEEQLEEKPRLWVRFARGAIALATGTGLVYFSGIYQYFFFERTAPSIEQEVVATLVDEKPLLVPLTIFIVQSDGISGSERTEDDAKRLVEQADRIWEQARIDLDVKAVHRIEKTDQEIKLFYEHARLFMNQLENFDSASINVMLLVNLQGLNGISYGGLSTLAVADYTTVFDFRVLAHEIGHQLGLSHTQDQKRLMHQGANSFELSIQEVRNAREFAKQFQ